MSGNYPVVVTPYFIPAGFEEVHANLNSFQISAGLSLKMAFTILKGILQPLVWNMYVSDIKPQDFKAKIKCQFLIFSDSTPLLPTSLHLRRKPS